MAKYTTLPSELHHLVPAGDGAHPAEQLDEDLWVVAGKHALILIDSKQCSVVDSGLWHEVQFARWQADTRKLTVVWAEPDHPGFSGITQTEDAGRFMEAVTVRTERTILATRSIYTPSGTRISATVRRRPDGELFSVLVADGPLSDKEVARGEEIEATLRSELGMDGSDLAK